MIRVAALAFGAALAIWALIETWPRISGGNARAILDLMPELIILHLSQLLLAGLAWRALLPEMRPPVLLLWRLRIVREGVDSLLPVAQIGGEMIGARLLARHVSAATAGSSVIVDLAVELLTQLAFLSAGLLTLGWLSGGVPNAHWLLLLAAALATVCGLVFGIRFGLLRAVEQILRAIARRMPTIAGTSLHGLHDAAIATWRRGRGVAVGILLHLPAWALGSVETWLILRALGHPVGLGSALVVESLGMAGRSAGFAIPAAIGAQEVGFVLAAATIGLAAGPAIVLSLVKRVREIVVGLIGLSLWWMEPAS